MSKKEKKEKVVYVDDGSSVADMSGLSGGKRLRNTGGSSARDKWNTYWDAVKMMFTPMLFVSGFYARSLLLMSVVVFVAWELSVLLHPGRFWFQSNETLQCAHCTDKLCTQYCQNLR